MKTVSTLAAAVLLLASNTAAALERFDCHVPGDSPTIVELDRTTKTFAFTVNDKKTQFDHETVCGMFGKIMESAVGDKTILPPAQCTVAFGTDVIAADYRLQNDSLNLLLTIALDIKAMKLLSIGRFNTADGFTEIAPCKRL